MSYTLRPSASGDSLSSSRDPIRTNFELIQSRFDENHVGIDGGAGGGKHNFMQMPEQAPAAIPTTAANEAALYVKENDSAATLFFRQESDGTEVQLTTSQTPTNAASGCSFLPGGLLIQWGLGTFGNGNSTVVITFPQAFTGNAYSVLGTRISSDTDNRTLMVSPGTVTATQVTFIRRHTGDNHTFYWMAIGSAS